MEHLSPLDAIFLEAEDSDPHVSLAIAGLSIIEGPVPSYDAMVAAYADKVAVIPRCTQKLHMQPLDLGSPGWVDDPDFDIGHHMHRIALPKPGDDAELFKMVATLMERRLDRERPLWECWIIEDLAEDRWAILMKLHHCIADGIAATQLLASLSDDDAGASFATDIRGSKEPGATSRLPFRLSLNPLDWAGGLIRASSAFANIAAHAAIGAAELTVGVVHTGPESSLSGPVTKMRRYSAARVPIADMQAVARAFDVTLNDVALAAISDSYRHVLLARGERPKHDSLRTLVPVSIRSLDAFGQPDNRVSAMLPLLPVDEADPVKRLKIVHGRLTAAKDSGQREGGSAFVGLISRVPFVLQALAVRSLMRLPQRGVVALATNVPGPRGRQHVMGREVLEVLPVPPIALGLRTGVAMVSYADKFVFGITADYDGAPDIDDLARGIERGVARLVALSSSRRRDRSVG